MTGNTVLALDVGEARIGLARGERGSSFVFGRGWLERSSPARDIAELKRRMEEEGASLLIVGLPRRSDGADSEQTRRVRTFAEQLSAAGLAVEFEDERFTTRIAEQQIAGSLRGRHGRREKGLRDEAAAVLILETWLARQENR